MGVQNYIKKRIEIICAKIKASKKNVLFDSHTETDLHTTFEGNNRVSKGTAVLKSSIGFGTYFGWNSRITNAFIGKYCSIGPRCNVVLGEHPTTKFVSTHPAFYSVKTIAAPFTYVEKQKYEEYRYVNATDKVCVKIGNDVWIGSDVTILGGISIGDGAIVAAGAVVTKDIEPYSIYGGVPAKKIRNRFSEDQKVFLLRLQWWNKPEDWIRKHSDYFDDVDRLKEVLENE